MARPAITKRSALPILAVLCLLLTSLTPSQLSLAQAPPTTPPGCWSIVPTPATGLADASIQRLSASGTELWAAGTLAQADSPNPYSPILMRWTGSEWSPLPALPITQAHSIAAVKVFSPSDVWVMGTYAPRGQTINFSLLTAHWDGTRWQLIPNPMPALGGTAFNDMDGTSGSDLWLVGTTSSGPHGSQHDGIVLHWDGRTWTQHDVPNASGVTDLNRVVAISPIDVWVVGNVILHWDGRVWSSSSYTPSFTLYDITAIAPNDIWAVGDRLGPAAAHWDGSSWTINQAGIGARNGSLTGVAALARDDVWAVGQVERDAVLTHWDGTGWTNVPNPIPAFASDLNDIAVSSGTFWAAGQRQVRGPQQYPNGDTVILRYSSTPCTTAGLQRPLNPPLPLPGAGTQSFITGKSTGGIFLKYWQEHGGLAQQGYPISEIMGEVSDLDGKLYTIQYFERATFEYHPELRGTPYEVLLTQLGTLQYKRKYPNGAPNQRANQDPGTLTFPETGKHLGGTFLEYWRANGGLAQQGYPISEEFTEVSDLNGRPYTVQYFERAVFEWHPENNAPFNVLLSQLGTYRFSERYVGSLNRTGTPRRIASSVLPGTLHGGGHHLVWQDIRSSPFNPVMYSYDASQNREQPISEPMQEFGIPLVTNGSIALWSRRNIDRRYLDGYDFRTNATITINPPAEVSSPDFRRAEIALDAQTLYYTDNWPGHTGIFAHDLATATERKLYDRLPDQAAKFDLAAGDGVLLWTEQRPIGTRFERSLHLYRSDAQSLSVATTGIGAFTGYGASGDYIVYSFYNTISDQKMTLYNLKTNTGKVIATGPAGSPAIQGNRVAWARWPTAPGETGGWKIEVYNISSGTTSTLVPGFPAMPTNVTLLDNDKLAFTADTDLSTPGAELYIVDIEK